MNIQQNLNALLTMGAVAARTSGKYETNQELKKLNKSEKGLQNYGKALLQDYNQDQTEAGLNLIGENIQDTADIFKEKAQLDPKYTLEAVESRITQDTLYEDMKEQFYKNKAKKQQALYRYTSETDTVRSQRQAMDDRLEIIRSKANKFDKMKNLLDDYNKKQGGKK